MKVYEALKEMMENGKTIKIKDSDGYNSFKLGHKDWAEEPVILRESEYSRGWHESSFEVLIREDGFSDKWEIVK